MAVIWQRRNGGTVYEVRQAGHSVRLYTNGIFHSQYNEHFPLAGSVWDLLVLPALFYPPRSIQRVLVLGVGGGAVLRQLRQLVQPAHITGVELDPVHLQVARRFFGLRNSKSINLVHADAVEWVNQYNGPKFDLVIDDLFCESEQGPGRAVEANVRWCQTLSSLLSPQGVLVMNFDSPKAMRGSQVLAAPVKKSFNTGYSLLNPGFENRIVALFKTDVDSQDLKQGLAHIADHHGKAMIRRLNVAQRRLF